MQRTTKQRTAIIRALERAARPLGPDEIRDAAIGDVPRIGVATVYRTVASLADDGVITPVQLPNQPTRYEIRNDAHHHHFSCNVCGKVFPLVGCAQGLRALLPDGYVLESHDIILRGKCTRCAEA